MKHLAELREKRKTYMNSADHILSAVESEKRGLTADEKRSLDDLKKKIDGIDETLTVANEIRDLHQGDEKTMKHPGESRSSAGPRLAEGEFRALTREERFSDYVQSQGNSDETPLSMGRTVRGMVIGDWSGAEAERRSMSESTGGVGGWLVSPGLSGQIIDLARNKTAVIRAGARTLPMEAPEVTLAKVTAGPTAYWRAENVAITESEMGFVPIKMKAVSLGCIARLSLELFEDVDGLTGSVEDAMSSAIALELDRAALLGSGVGEPRGLYNTTGVNAYSMGDNGAVLSNYDPFSLACEYIADANGTAGSVIYSPRTAGKIDRLKDSTNQPLVAPESFKGLSKFSTNQVPITQTQGTATTSSFSAVGDFSQMVIGMRTRLVLEASRVSGTDTFAKMQVLIRAYIRADVAVLRPSFFSLVKGIL